MTAGFRRFLKGLVRWRWRRVPPPYARLFEPAIARTTTFLWPPAPPPNGPVQYVVLSPHLDDAPLSLGGHMLQWGTRCLIVDLFSTVSWWRFPIDSHEDPRMQRVRDAEEDLMAELTGASLRRVGLMEAPRRGYPLDDIFTADVLPTERAGETIAAAVAALAAEGSFEWFLPLAVGNHVDHRIARDAALAALLAAAVPRGRIHFFEDLPYAAQTPGVQDYSTFIPGVRLELAEQTPINAKRKSTLLQVYYSQLTESQIKSVGDYAARFGGVPRERLWKLLA